MFLFFSCSLTIVWQDSIGGLETYCRSCKKWIPVPPPSIAASSNASDNTWHCIVHVGDMASLALGEPNNPTSDVNFDQCYWPSPKHRVLTSNQERVSLVFFTYPQPLTTLTTIREKLKEWKSGKPCGNCLPLKEYYLLQNQSEVTRKLNSTENQSYSSLESKAIRIVIQEKWGQVQRSS